MVLSGVLEPHNCEDTLQAHVYHLDKNRASVSNNDKELSAADIAICLVSI